MLMPVRHWAHSYHKATERRRHGTNSFFAIQSHIVGKIRSKQYFEAEQLLEEISSWSEDEVEGLPRLYREKAREFRRLANTGQE
jgi:hypothetical protein